MSQNRKPRGVHAKEDGCLKLAEAKSAGQDEDGQRLTYDKIALEARVDAKTVRRLFKGEAVDIESAILICKALGLEVSEIVDLNPSAEEPDKNGQKGSNPFGYGTPVPPERFCGRNKTLEDVENRIGAISAQCINVVGFRRSGKSSLLQYIKYRPDKFCSADKKPLMALLDLQYARHHTPEGVTEGLRREITKLTGKEPWTENADFRSFDIEDGLTTLREQGYRLIVLLDELERVGQKLEQFQDWGDDWRAKACAGLFSLVIASKRPIPEIFQTLGLSSPFDNIFSTTVLGALESEAWHGLVQEGFSQNALPAPTLKWIDELSGGLPYFVQMAAAMLWQYGNVEAAESNFMFQAKPRFQELWNNLKDPEQVALKFAVGLSAAQPTPALTQSLQFHGLLRSDKQLFSRAFAEFIREGL